MANSPNLKINVNADTSGFSKGMRAAKTEMRDFSTLSKSALDSIGGAFGVNTQKIQQLTSAAKGLGQTMAKSGNEGTAAIGKMIAGMGGLSTAVAGLGIGAAVAAFKLLNDEADNFKKTVAGANIELQTQAYLETYRQALHDMNANLGKAAAESGAEWSKGWARAWNGIKQTGTGILQGDGLVVAAIKANAQGKVANELAKEAAQIAGEIYKIDRQISDQMVTMSDLDAQIAEEKRKSMDSTLSTAEQAAALAKATELIKQKYEGSDGIIALEKQKADLMEKSLSLTNSSPQAIDAANQQRIKANNLVRQEQEEIRALTRRQNTLNSEIAKEVAERQKAAALARSKANLAEFTKVGGNLDLSGVRVERGTEAAIVKPVVQPNAWTEFYNGAEAGFLKEFPDGLKIGVAFDAQEGLIDLSKVVQGALADMAAGMSETIGTLIGDLASGGDAWGNFANSAVTAFGDMAIAIGKMAISTGVATLGIKAALESLNPYAAIAAGAALVALGAAVKAGMRNIAGGNYSASSNVASSGNSYSNNTGMYERSNVQIEVTGTLKASGSQLVAVINNENKRTNHTT